MPTGNTRSRPKPHVMPQFCKACGRCIDACPKDCIALGTEIEPSTGFTPIVLDLEACNGCGLCFSACPEPYGLAPVTTEFETELFDPAKAFGAKESTAVEPVAIPDEQVALPHTEPLVLKGNHAAAIGAILAGCRHFFGYPITPSTEGAELMAKLLPEIDGVFVQAVSEVATINMMYGCGGAGMRSMTFTSSPGFSLMVEGISYMIGAEVPGVIVDVMRGGPGLGNIAPEQSDIKLLCRGLGHGNTHAPVLAPSTPQEMLEMAMLAFELAFKYRNPVVIAGDGYLGQMTGRVTLPDTMTKPGLPEWAVWGDEMHRGNLINSIFLAEPDLEAHNIHLNEKYERMKAEEQRADLFQCDDADWLIVACNTPARMAKGAVQQLRQEGIKAGLFRPITLWPFPIDALAGVIDHVEGLLVVEGSNGQLEDELRLAMSHAGLRHPRIENVRHFGGILPSMHEIVDKLTSLSEVAA
ncbi:MAG: 3-methyl-2-oxobutanoate dehydrogenase subunit VorB [Nitrospirae bacterium]|nr:3-methyl-2-oxobutanoate dehydrogenase subunit VorB [Nitrospirota bacterium]